MSKLKANREVQSTGALVTQEQDEAIKDGYVNVNEDDNLSVIEHGNKRARSTDVFGDRRDDNSLLEELADTPPQRYLFCLFVFLNS